MSTDIKVSVSIITYNQEDLIAEAIESVLMQAVDFRYQIVVGDDSSTDSTPEILARYQKEHPDTITIVNHESNVGASQNVLDTLKVCEGEYIASLDGDDYWTSPNKLQKLASVLDKHPECPMCFHNTQLLFEDDSEAPRIFWQVQSQSFFTTEDLVRDSGAISSATMWRKEVLLHAVHETEGVIIGDKARAIVAAQFGNVGYIPDTMSVWRIHQRGAFSHGSLVSFDNNIRKGKAWFQFYKFIDEYFDGQYNDILLPDITLQHYVLLKTYLRKRELKNCFYHLTQLFYSSAVRKRKQISSIFIPIFITAKLCVADFMRIPELSLRLMKSLL